MVENLAAIKKRRGKLDESYWLHRSSLERFTLSQDKAGQAYALRNIGDVALMRKNSAIALRIYGVSIDLFTEIGDHFGAAQAQITSAVAFLQMGKPWRAFCGAFAAVRLAGPQYVYKFSKRTWSMRKVRPDSESHVEIEAHD
jgi:hypothetical protein